jgi:hypothetical protein
MNHGKIRKGNLSRVGLSIHSVSDERCDTMPLLTFNGIILCTKCRQRASEQATIRPLGLNLTVRWAIQRTDFDELSPQATAGDALPPTVWIEKGFELVLYSVPAVISQIHTW